MHFVRQISSQKPLHHVHHIHANHHVMCPPCLSCPPCKPSPPCLSWSVYKQILCFVTKSLLHIHAVPHVQIVHHVHVVHYKVNIFKYICLDISEKKFSRFILFLLWPLFIAQNISKHMHAFMKKHSYLCLSCYILFISLQLWQKTLHKETKMCICCLFVNRYLSTLKSH